MAYTIKTRKQLEQEYYDKYNDVPEDIEERLAHCLGDKYNQELLEKAKNEVEYKRSLIEYESIRITFYEKPIQTHRGRVSFNGSIYSPNAASNMKAVKAFIETVNDVIQLIAIPLKLSMKTYYPMPNTVTPLEALLYETEHDYAYTDPDFDNVEKAYSDMIQDSILLNDNLVVRADFVKYFSFKPRVELIITYPTAYATKSAYKTIIKRKSYIDNKDRIKIMPLIETQDKTKKGGKKK